MNTPVIVNRLGGTVKLARICDVTPSAVSQWKKRGIPKPWMTHLKSQYPAAFEIPAQPWELEEACAAEETLP
jgi:hypothetical protein